MVDGRLIRLIEEYNPLSDEVNENTCLYHDLNIFGDDAADLINEYSIEYRVSLSKFVFSKYFPSEGDSVLPFILRFLRGKREKEYKRLSINDLDMAVKKGFLI